MTTCPVVSSGSEKGCGSRGGEGGRVGRSLAGRSGFEAHRGGRDKGTNECFNLRDPCAVLVPLNKSCLIDGEQHEVGALQQSLLLNSLALMLLYLESTSLHLDVYLLLPSTSAPLAALGTLSQSRMHMASTMQGDKAGEPADKKHPKRKENKRGDKRQDRGKSWRGGREMGTVEWRRGRGRREGSVLLCARQACKFTALAAVPGTNLAKCR